MKQCSACTNKQKYLTKLLCSKCYYKVNRNHILAHKSKTYDPLCKKAYNGAYYLANRETLLLDKKEYFLNNQSKLLTYKKSHYLENRQAIVAHNLKYIIARSKIDPMFRLSRNLRSRLYSAIKNNYKSGSAIQDLGCSIEELKVHLEGQFTQTMTWDNYGPKGWHVDHIRPLCSFDLSDLNQLKQACNYANLRPLWWSDNLSKGGKV